MAHIQDVSKGVGREIHHLFAGAQALIDATTGEQEARIKSARDALAGRLESAKDALGRAEGRFLEKIKTVDTAVHEKPYYAIGGAGFCGLLLGWLLSRK